jgi:hypothetical protein
MSCFSMHSLTAYIFLAECGRSGTSLLKGAGNSHFTKINVLAIHVIGLVTVAIVPESEVPGRSFRFEGEFIDPGRRHESSNKALDQRSRVNLINLDDNCTYVDHE